MATTIWQIDPMHSDVSFRVRHLIVATATGKFKNFSAVVTTEGDDFSTAKIEFSVETGSIETGVADRDNHLRSDDFFNSEKYPAMTFKSTGIKSSGDNEYQLDGNLTIRDVTLPVTLQVEFGGIAKDPYGQIKSGFEVSGKIKRKEYGLSWNALTEAGGAVVADEVKIQANVEFVKVVAA